MSLDIEHVAEGAENGGGGIAIIRAGFIGGYDGRQAVELLMAIVCRTVSAVVSGRWHPDLAYFRHSAPDDLSVHCASSSARCCSTPSLTAWSAARRRSTRPIRRRNRRWRATRRRYLDMLVPEPADGTVSERARRSLYLLLPAGRATLEQVAANLGMHPRALQRQLEREGRTFATLLERGAAGAGLALSRQPRAQRRLGRAADRLCDAKLLLALVHRGVRPVAGAVAGGGTGGDGLSGQPPSRRDGPPRMESLFPRPFC